MKKNVVLCGFMGCGKTTLGPVLAEKLGMSFVDADDYLEKIAGMTIPQMFAEYGEVGFRDREHEAIRQLVRQPGLVIATGGGALTQPRNALLLRETGVVLYLNPGFDTCYHRICTSDRPLVQKNTLEQLRQLYTEREAQYRQAAHLELNTNGDPSQCANRAAELLQSLI